MVHAVRGLLRWVALAASAAGAGCGGYADLPLPLRESAPLTVHEVALFSAGTGRIEVSFDLPDDALGPVVIVGHPAFVAGSGLRVISWAWGGCDGAVAPPTSPRLCIAADVVSPSPFAAPPVQLVFETRGDGRRFTASAPVELP